MNAEATGASTARRKRERKPPTRVSSSSVVDEEHGVGLGEDVAARTCASSCASTAPSSSGVRAVRSPELTTRVELRGPRPTTNARGKPSSISCSFGGGIVELGRDPVGGRAEQRVLRERERPRAEHAEQRAVADRVRGARREQRAEREERGAAGVGEQPADPAEDRGEQRRRGARP